MHTPTVETVQGLLTRATTLSQLTIYTHHTKSQPGVVAQRRTRATLPCQQPSQPSTREKASPFHDDQKAKAHPCIPKRQPRHASTLKNDHPDAGHLPYFHRFIVVFLLHENPMVLPSSHRNSVHSSMKIVCRYDRSSVNPNTVIPALLFSK